MNVALLKKMLKLIPGAGLPDDTEKIVPNGFVFPSVVLVS
jgi:hypothetical protein